MEEEVLEIQMESMKETIKQLEVNSKLKAYELAIEQVKLCSKEPTETEIKEAYFELLKEVNLKRF